MPVILIFIFLVMIVILSAIAIDRNPEKAFIFFFFLFIISGVGGVVALCYDLAPLAIVLLTIAGLIAVVAFVIVFVNILFNPGAIRVKIEKE